MESSRRILLAGVSLFVLVSLSGCHATGSQTTTTWVSKTDNHKTLEITFRDASALTRVHLTVMKAKESGKYIMKSGGKSSEGRVRRDGDSYVLELDGKTQRFVSQEGDTLKDESGGIWELNALVHIDG